MSARQKPLPGSPAHSATGCKLGCLGCRVTVKGEPDEEAVLCTSTATFALKHVETTNSLFIVPGPSRNSAAASINVTVAATADAHIELVPTAPRFAALDRVLEVTMTLLDPRACQFLMRTCGMC